ncbi:unnamed protein product [Adineta steineri]|uniref:Uncharacterized protein n=1 Tax=Adineta steineri TaxID=433720 RepID=A0A815U599_9BILA|nr:unnamed protein product [Adineta steineri]CAF1646886.1 unnamed protein product [Adineta steineri]
MKTDVSTNIDDIVQQVMQMEPQPGSPNYETNSRLYDSILDQVTQMMEDLERTFMGILGEFDVHMDQLWLAISNDKEDQLRVAQESFRAILDKYSTQWNRAFQDANDKIHRFESDLARESMQQ